MRTLFITFFISLLLSGTTVFAGDILVLQSMRVKPFDEALRGFKSVCKRGSKTVVVSETQGTDFLKKVREEKPEFILAIGADALQRVKKIRNIPIMYTMVLNPEKIAGAASNITGVSMNIAPEKYLGLMEKLNLPKLSVGLFYDPSQSEELLKRIQHAARLKGIEITAEEVHKCQEVPDLLNKMKGSFTLFWMLPDPMIVTPEIVKHLLLYTQQNGVPIVTFAGKYVDQGALISLEIDSFDMGQQAGEMANRVLDGTLASSIPNTEARKGVMKINRSVASELGINLNSLENSMNVNQALSYIPGNN